MTGWRIGYAAGPEPLIKAMGELQSQSTTNPCVDLAMGRGRGAQRAAGFHPEQQQGVQGAPRSRRVDAEPGEGPDMPDAGGRLLRLSVLRGGDRQVRAVSGKKIETDEDFAKELLAPKVSQSCMAPRSASSPAFRDLLRDLDATTRGCVQSHPAVLRKLEVTARDGRPYRPRFRRPPLRLRGTFFPFLRASDKPMAIACFRLFTLLPLRPLLSVPRLRLRIARLTSLEAPREYLRAICGLLEDQHPLA